MARSSGFRNGWILGACLVVTGINALAQEPSTAQAPAASAPAVSAPAAVPGPPPAALTAQAKAQGIQITQGGTIQGSVVAGTPGKADAVPLPGVSVTATNTLTGKKYTAATDVDGKYKLSIAKNGRYVVRADLVGFASATAEVVLSGDLSTEAAKPTTFGMELASRAEAAEAKQEAVTAAAGATSLTHGVQNLSLGHDGKDTEDASVSSGNTGVTMPSLAAMNDSITGDTASSGADSITVSGQDAQMNGLANYSEDEIHQHIQDAMERARSEGRLPQGANTDGVTDAIVGAMGGMMSGSGPSMGGGGHHGGGAGAAAGGGGGSSHGGSSHGSGAFRGFNPSQPHGSVYYQGEYAGLDSAPWAATLLPVTNPDYAKNSFGVTFIGSPYIPGLIKPNTSQFVSVSFTGKRDTNPEVLNGIVPTDNERNGIFPSVITDPRTGTTTNTIPTLPGCAPGQFCIQPQSLSILNNYYPACNVAGCHSQTGQPSQYNYQTVTTAGSNISSLNTRYVRNIGQNASNPFAAYSRHSSNGPPQLHQNINSSFSYSHSASDSRNIFLLLGGAAVSNGYSFGLGYTVSYGHLSDSVNVSWNRSHGENRNYFTDTSVDPIDITGIGEGACTPTTPPTTPPTPCSVPSNHAISFRPNFYNGLPTIQLTQFQSLSNTEPSDQISQAISLSDSVSWRLHHHSMHYGFDFRRVHQDSLGGTTALGSLSFTGIYTGSSFADFLLGLPQQSKIEAGLDKIYLRENVVSAYVMDDYHASNNVTVNYGARYEYFAPYSEKNNRLMNLTDVVTHAGSVGCVTPNGLSFTSLNGSTVTCAAGPNDALIHPDRSMISPRFGVAWSPKFVKQTVVRGGYGLNFNTSQFSAFAKKLSYQAPFAAVQNNVLTTAQNPTGCTAESATTDASITIAGPFGCSNKALQNSFGVNPNYRLGLVQVYNLDLQHTLPWGIVMNIGYNGSHGSNLDVVRAPNQNFVPVTNPAPGQPPYAATVTTNNAVAFLYEDSTGESTFNALTFNLQKRLQHGIGLGALYQYAHSIDDASTFGGASSTTSIQDDANLHAERSNSSFDVRHKLSVNWVYEPPFGPNRAFLNKGGFWSNIADGWIVAGSATFTSGQYFTPQYTGTAAQTAAGGTFTLRPDRDFAQSTTGSGQLARFFNPNAFSCPSSTTPGLASNAACQPTHYGSASRYSIEGPGTVLVSASFSRQFSLGDTRNLETRITASNVFNTVQYSGINTTANALNFGQVTSAATMRQINFTARYRF